MSTDISQSLTICCTSSSRRSETGENWPGKPARESGGRIAEEEATKPELFAAERYVVCRIPDKTMPESLANVELILVECFC